MKNSEILTLQAVMNQVKDQPIRGGLKFKLLKVFQVLEPSVRIIIDALEGCNEEEAKEILAQTQTIDLPTLTMSELESLELSISQLSVLIELAGGEQDAGNEN